MHPTRHVAWSSNTGVHLIFTPVNQLYWDRVHLRLDAFFQLLQYKSRQGSESVNKTRFIIAASADFRLWRINYLDCSSKVNGKYNGDYTKTWEQENNKRIYSTCWNPMKTNFVVPLKYLAFLRKLVLKLFFNWYRTGHHQKTKILSSTTSVKDELIITWD